MSSSRRPRPAPTGHDLLTVYLNDHFAGATAGLGLARRLVKAHSGLDSGAQLTAIANEIAQDRATLAEIMKRLDVPTKRHKVIGAWLGERASRLKLNGRVSSRSPLSTLVELEAMRLGVDGKVAGWRSLRELAEGEPRLDRDQLDGLMARARQQSDVLEDLRVRAVATVFG